MEIVIWPLAIFCRQHMENVSRGAEQCKMFIVNNILLPVYINISYQGPHKNWKPVCFGVFIAEQHPLCQPS